MNFSFVNGEFVSSNKACLSVHDLSIQRGYAVFEFLRLKGNKPLFADDHLQRLSHSASAMRLKLPYSAATIKAIVEELVTKNQLPDSGIRITLTGGISADGFSLGEPSFIITQQQFKSPTAEEKKCGIRLMSFAHQRQLPGVKTTDYLMALWLQPLMKNAGAADILYHNNGWITECPRSNFFVVMDDDKILTPSENILKGITRKKLIELASKQFNIEERPLKLEEFSKAKEAFITSTTKEILPVVAVDDYRFGQPRIALELQQAFQQLVDAEA